MAQATADFRAVVVTGAGRAFCADADLKEVAAGRSVDSIEHPEWSVAGLARHWIGKPLVAAVNGFALGGGTELAPGRDVVIASESTSFGLPEASRGLLAAAGGVIRLQRQIPLKFGLRLALTGDPVEAITANQWGLVNEDVAPEQMPPRAPALAQRIAQNAPLAVQRSKQLVHQTAGGGSDWDAAWTAADPWPANNASMEVAFTSSDAHDGAIAFAERRAPIWRGE